MALKNLKLGLIVKVGDNSNILIWKINGFIDVSTAGNDENPAT